MFVRDSLPLAALEPLQSPLAVQLVAFVLLQFSVELPPLVTEVGDEVKVTLGGGVVQFSPGWPLLKLLLGVQVLELLRSKSLSTRTSFFLPMILTVFVPAFNEDVTWAVDAAVALEFIHCH